MAIPSGCLFRVPGCSEGAYSNSNSHPTNKDAINQSRTNLNTPEVTAGNGKFPVRVERSPPGTLLFCQHLSKRSNWVLEARLWVLEGRIRFWRLGFEVWKVELGSGSSALGFGRLSYVQEARLWVLRSDWVWEARLRVLKPFMWRVSSGRRSVSLATRLGETDHRLWDHAHRLTHEQNFSQTQVFDMFWRWFRNESRSRNQEFHPSHL